MSTSVATRTRRTVEEARAAILDAAEGVVREVGPAGLRITAVAEKAGMAHPNVLHHFGSREGLLQALTTRAVQRATDRVVRAIGDSVDAGPQDRLAALTRILDAMDEGDQGRILAWLVISGRAGEYEQPDMEPLVHVAHQWRTAAVGPAEVEDTRRLVLLSAMALVGDAVSGQGLVESFQLGRGEEGRRAFRAWLAELLLRQPASNPTSNPTVVRG